MRAVAIFTAVATVDSCVRGPSALAARWLHLVAPSSQLAVTSLLLEGAGVASFHYNKSREWCYI